MSFAYYSLTTKVVDILKAHNTTTASPNLSANMSATFDDSSIMIGDPETQSPPILRYPLLFVRVNNKSDDPGGLGLSGAGGNNRFAEVQYDIIGLYMKQGAHRDFSALEQNVLHMASNIEGVFHANERLSNTALWCNPESSEFLGTIENGDGTWVRGVKVSVRAKYQFS